MKTKPSTWPREWWRTAKSFTRVWYAFLFIFAASSAIMIVQYAFPTPVCFDGYPLPATTCYLSNSAATPWGIVTSMFVHSSFLEHYTPNFVGLLVFIVFFIATNARIPSEERRTKQNAFVALMFISAALANVASLVIQPNSLARGASGLVYATWGIASAFCLINALRGFLSREGPKAYYGILRNLRWSINNGLVFIPLIGGVFIAPKAFLGVGPGVNVLAHGLGFFFAFAGVIVWHVSVILTGRASSVR